MNTEHGHSRYWTTRVEDRTDGCAGVRLHHESFGRSSDAAEIIFWDATGGFTIKTLNGDVPVEVIEALITEARTTIKTQ